MTGGRAVLMSIRAPYADAIMDGTKTVEFRKLPPRTAGDILVYRSGGQPDQRGIVGTFTADEVVSGTAFDHLREVGRENAGIGLVDLENYAGGTRALIWRIHITNLLRFAGPVPLAAIGVDRAPQSWQFVTRDQYTRALRGVF